MRSAFVILLIGSISCSSPHGALSHKPKVVPLLIDLTPYYKKDLSPAASPRLLRSTEGEEAGRAAPSTPSSGPQSSGSHLSSNRRPVLIRVNRDRAASSRTRHKRRRVLFRRLHFPPAASGAPPRSGSR
ncbi:hypothetical protein OJAV_G00195440 [Oryzias javanicus]|uniref:Uncharacterized protein n=1 Tax=Oryzias javanicus TaxID=123683 RepID=A0A3S2NWY2_ORYJA|nr:hypothetical protein OJAV_G00195440 [Oryzias javanicus]